MLRGGNALIRFGEEPMAGTHAIRIGSPRTPPSPMRHRRHLWAWLLLSAFLLGGFGAPLLHGTQHVRAGDAAVPADGAAVVAFAQEFTACGACLLFSSRGPLAAPDAPTALAADDTSAPLVEAAVVVREVAVVAARRPRAPPFSA